ncbi:MAG: hypothetical protein HY660_05610 [Armatimonadetes bacterium]|nr:hypothetical protein [Armatimonadota bacterium]
MAGIIDGERPFAIVRAGQAMHVVSEGDLIGTVRVVRIDAETRKVVFAFNSSTAEVRLGGDQSP